MYLQVAYVIPDSRNTTRRFTTLGCLSAYCHSYIMPNPIQRKIASFSLDKQMSHNWCEGLQNECLFLGLWKVLLLPELSRLYLCGSSGSVSVFTRIAVHPFSRNRDWSLVINLSPGSIMSAAGWRNVACCWRDSDAVPRGNGSLESANNKCWKLKYLFKNYTEEERF